MKLHHILPAFFLFAMACSNDSTESVTTTSGVKIKYFERGTDSLELDKILVINAVYKMQDGDTLIASTPGFPLAMFYDNTTAEQSGLIKEVVDMLNVGDSVYFELPVVDLWEVSFRSPLPDTVGEKETVKVNFKILHQMNQMEYQAFMSEMESKMYEQEYMQEELVLEDFITTNQIEAEKTASGLYYVLQNQGTGDFAQVSDNVQVKYTGTLLNGQQFDAGTFSFNLGQGEVIPGWDEGIALLKKGGKATLYIPSKLAYRNRSAGAVIAPFSTLKFEVELLDIN